MENQIREIVLELGFNISATEENNIEQDNRTVSIIEHNPNDINFVQEQMLTNIDVLITFDINEITIATRGNNQETGLINRLQQVLNMQILALIEPQAHFNFNVTTIRRNEL